MLDASSSLADVLAAYKDNGSYRETSSRAKALAFLTACNLLVAMRPKRVSIGARSEELELDLTVLQAQKQEAEAWLARHPAPGARFRFAGFDFFRR